MATSDSVVSTLNGTAIGSARFMPPEELAMQSLTKQLYKSRLFRGHYLERCYVEQLGEYRDVIALQRSERELEKLLLRSTAELQLFYQRFVPQMWVGITKGSVGSYKHSPQADQLDTCIWTETNDLAFGEYWFSIKTIRYRDQEVQFKLKMIRPVEPEMHLPRQRSVSRSKSTAIKALTAAEIKPEDASSPAEEIQDKLEIGLADFVSVLQQWGESIKHTVYDFMANDINKRNIVSTLRFLGVLVMALLSGAVVAVRFLGMFTLRFLFELSRFTHTATPIVHKLIEFVSKIFGAFFILLTMIWKDLVVNRGKPGVATQPLEAIEDRRGQHYKRLTYRRPVYEGANFQ